MEDRVRFFWGFQCCQIHTSAAQNFTHSSETFTLGVYWHNPRSILFVFRIFTKSYFSSSLWEKYILFKKKKTFRKLSGHNVLGFALNIARFHPAMWKFGNWISILAWGVTFFHIIWDPSISKKGRQWKNNEKKKKKISPPPFPPFFSNRICGSPIIFYVSR